MNLIRLTTIALLAAIFAGGLLLNAEEIAKDQELFNDGKILIFDRKWDEARVVFQRVVQQFPKSPLVPQAVYYQGRCLQLQGKESEALRTYEEFLQKYPNEPYFPLEARKATVEIAAGLTEKGNSGYKDRLIAALQDPNKDVRYFAAIRCSYLKDRELASIVKPVLIEIIEKEKEQELVDRSRIALLRLDPKGLSNQAEAQDQKRPTRGTAKMFHLQIFNGKDADRPAVDVNLPIALAQLAVMALDQSTKDQMKKEGIDVSNIWESLKEHTPMNILTIRNGKEIVKIWIE